MTRDQKHLVRLALKNLQEKHERAMKNLKKDYESEKARLEHMLCQAFQRK